MKLHILSPCASGQIDGTIKNQILDRLPNLVDSVLAADAVVLPISFFANYQFNEALYKLKGKPLIVVDFLEYSTFWNGEETHLLGKNLQVAKNLFNKPEWMKLDGWLAANPPAMYFKRELLNRDRTDRVRPIEFLCYLDIPPVQSRAEFDARPFEVFHCWGYSHHTRPQLHAWIFEEGMARRGLGVISDWSHAYPYMQSPQKRTWVSIYSPHYVRKPIAEMLWWHERSKIMVSLPGAGYKCFRSAEVVNSVHALMGENDIAWSYPWEHGVNAIHLKWSLQGSVLWEVTTFEMHLLYDIYVAGQETLRKYQPENYIRDYLIPAIKGAL